jgi:dipeptidyl aminopeptidase/acylaminoacyl peptidase
MANFSRNSHLPLLTGALVLFAACTLPAQTPAAAARNAVPSGVAISPDGKSLAYLLGGRTGIALHVAAVADAKDDKVVKPSGPEECSIADPVWSPDNQSLAFTSTCLAGENKPDQEQVVLWSKATGEFKQLTHLTGNLQQLAWSPDGKAIAFLFVENATRSAGATAAMKPWAGVIGEDGVEIQRVYAINVSNGLGDWISADEKLHVYEFAWAPNSTMIAYVAAPAPGENTWWIAQLYTQTIGQFANCGLFGSPAISMCKTDGAPMGVPQSVLNTQTVAGSLHGLQIAVPRYSSDGKKIAFIGGLMSDQGSTGGDVWVVDAKGGVPVDVTPDIDGTPVWLSWISDHSVAFVEDRRGHTLVSAVNVNDSKIVPGAPMDLGEVSVSGGAIKGAVSYSDRLPGSKDRVMAFVKSGHAIAPELWIGSPDALKQFTHLNEGATNPTRIESVEWENEGFHVQGWLTYPKDYDPTKKYPLIVQVHGGPSASAGARWGVNTWAELGYFEFDPNPRGSFGQGEKFTAANRKDFGYGDLRDITSGMDAIERKIPAIDHDREGIMGWSYGGYMTMFAVTQTHRFKAAVAGAGISNWQSYYGENSIDQWMVPFFGATVYDDPAVYAKSSPITFIKNATTPTLVIVGDRDGECPPPQSFEFWHALRAEGVKTQLVVYPNEGHHFADPAHTRDQVARTVEWFKREMAAK